MAEPQTEPQTEHQEYKNNVRWTHPHNINTTTSTTGTTGTTGINDILNTVGREPVVFAVPDFLFKYIYANIIIKK